MTSGGRMCCGRWWRLAALLWLVNAISGSADMWRCRKLRRSHGSAWVTGTKALPFRRDRADCGPAQLHDQQRPPVASPPPRSAQNTHTHVRVSSPLRAVQLTVTSANVLAPIYNRLDANGTRESHFEDVYLQRHAKVIEQIVGVKDPPPDVICLQEFWVRDEKFKSLYTERLCQQLKYRYVEVERTNHRGDGVVCFVSPRVQLVDYRPILFYDCGDRVAILCRVLVNDPENTKDLCEVLVVNTHLLFPHNAYSSRIRLREVQKVLGFIDKYKKDEDLGALPIIFVGDLNGTPSGQVARYLRDKGFTSSFEVYNSESPDKLSKWISHLSHRGQYIGVDYIWHLQPDQQGAPLAADWRKLVFTEIQSELPQAVRTAFSIFDSDDNKFIDPQEFKETLKRLGFTGEGRPALTDDEINALFQSADRDDNGMIDFKEFVDRFWEQDLYKTEEGTLVTYAPKPMRRPKPIFEVAASGFEGLEDEELQFFNSHAAIMDNARVMTVHDCYIEPREMEEGVWPADYKISDHGFLTCTFQLDAMRQQLEPSIAEEQQQQQPPSPPPPPQQQQQQREEGSGEGDGDAVRRGAAKGKEKQAA